MGRASYPVHARARLAFAPTNMELRGSGDRWLAGERLDGVAFAHHARVRVKSGAFEGKHGLVALLLGLGNDPLYIVKLSSGADVRVRQSSLTSDEGH